MKLNVCVIFIITAVLMTASQCMRSVNTNDPDQMVYFKSNPGVTQAYAFSFRYQLQISGDADIYYVALQKGSPAPNDSDILLGKGARGNAPLASGKYSVTSNAVSIGVQTGNPGSVNDIYILAVAKKGLPGVRTSTRILNASNATNAVFQADWASPGCFGIAIVNNRVVLVSQTGSGQVVAYDTNVAVSSSSSAVSSFGSSYSSSSASSSFSNPQYIDADSLGNIYVADSGNKRVVKLDPNLNIITAWGTMSSAGFFQTPCGIAVDRLNNVYVSDSQSNNVQKFDSSGNFILWWDGSAGAAGQFLNPRDVAVDSHDYVYVVDSGHNRVQKFTSAGAYVLAWGSQGDADDEFNGISGIAVDKAGHVFVSELTNGRIKVYDSEGNFITKFGTNGAASGQFNTPLGIAVDDLGNIYIADSGNGRIKIFR